MFDADKTRMIGLPYGEKNYDNMSLSLSLYLPRSLQNRKSRHTVQKYKNNILGGKQ